MLIGAEKTIGSIELSAPRGIAITQDNFIFVTDCYQIQRMTMNGVCIESVGGKKGNERLQFNTPSGLAISSTRFLLPIVIIIAFKYLIMTSLSQNLLERRGQAMVNLINRAALPLTTGGHSCTLPIAIIIVFKSSL